MKMIGYCDGSAAANGKADARASWGYLITYDVGNEHYEEEQGGKLEGSIQTNQRAEITAMIELCKRMMEIKKNLNEPCVFEIYSDSAYCINCYQQRWYNKWIANGWKAANGRQVKNIDLWRQLIPYFEYAHITFKKVKGHSGIENNERVDKIARSNN